MAAQGTSNSLAFRKTVVTGATDDLNIDSDNDTSSIVYFTAPAKLRRFMLLATTAVVSTTAVVVEVYKNTSTLVGTWTAIAANAGLAANKMAMVDVAECDTDGTASVGDSVVYVGCESIEVEAGDWLHFKVTEAASASGVVVTFVEYDEYPLIPDEDAGVTSVGSIVIA